MDQWCVRGASEFEMAKLTKTIVDSAEQRARDYYLWDDQLKGFGVRITPTGRKSYLVRYRVGGGRSAQQRKFRIGFHGSPWTVDAARKEAMRVLTEAAHGKDPADARALERQRTTFAAFSKRYIDEYATPKKKASSVAQDQLLMRVTLLPMLGQRNIRDITYADISKLHASLSKTPYKANRCIALLSKMFSLAEQWGVRDRHSNPCRDITKYKERRRERFLSPDEIKRLAETLDRSCDRGVNPQSIAIIRLLLLTGARKSEIIGLEWSEVDLPRRRLAKKDSKTGQKVIPISQPAADIIQRIPRLGDSPFVFPAARGNGHFQGLTKDWLNMRSRAGLEDVRLHDLRHTFASISIERGVPIAVLSRILGHASITTTERYAHLADDPLRGAVDEVSSALSMAFSHTGRHR